MNTNCWDYDGDVLLELEPACKLLDKHAYKTGHFVLQSGQTSSEYLDVKNALLDSQSRRIIGEHVLREIHGQRFDAVAGVIFGAMPLATYLSDRLRIPCLGVRVEKKAHGTQVCIEGLDNISPGANILLVEDVVTTGESTECALAVLISREMKVGRVVVVCDRGGLGALQASNIDIPMKALCTLEEVRDRRLKAQPVESSK